MPNAALLAMHARDRELGIDPMAPTPVVVIGEQKTWPQPFMPVPIDWHQEHLERQAAERARRAEERVGTTRSRTR